jgi:hypothetical protein
LVSSKIIISPMYKLQSRFTLDNWLPKTLRVQDFLGG